MNETGGNGITGKREQSEKNSVDSINWLIEARAQDVTPNKDRSELWAENWFFGVTNSVLSHMPPRPVSDEYVGGLIATFESFERECPGYRYGVYWAGASCVHVLYDRNGSVWSAAAIDLINPDTRYLD